MDLSILQNGHTYQEIVRQQEIWQGALASWPDQKNEHQEIIEKFRERVWVFSGCGTSYYLAQTGAALFEMITGFRTRAVPASEILTYPRLVFNPHDHYVLVALSRSGTTTEIVRAARKTKNELNCPVLSISCDTTSPLSKEGDHRLTFPFPAEKSVVMTGSFTTMLLSIVYLALQAKPQNVWSAWLEKIPAVSTDLMRKSESAVAAVADRRETDFVFLAQGPYLGLANEASLKIKEMSISPSVSYHALEFRHGPMSIVTGHTLITILVSEAGRTLELQLAEDMKKLGAQVLLLHSSKAPLQNVGIDFSLQVPDQFGDSLNAFLYMPLLQLLGYYHARCKGIHPDQPKNLTAVVTLKD